jgi:hypothetical protein
MAKLTFGNHSAVRVRRAERARIREFYGDVLGCKLTRQFDDKDDFRIGDDFQIAFLYESGRGASSALQHEGPPPRHLHRCHTARPIHLHK